MNQTCYSVIVAQDSQPDWAKGWGANVSDFFQSKTFRTLRCALKLARSYVAPGFTVTIVQS